MEKYASLSFQKQKELLEDFCAALLTIKTEDEAVKFLVDLLTKEEVMKLAKRIKIAQMLLGGKDYQYIKSAIQVSDGTIAKVAQWLREGGEGFKLAFHRTKKKTKELKPGARFDLVLNEWKRFKKQYSSMFWPSLLIEGIIKSADREEKEKMFSALKKLDKKSKIYKEVSQFFKP